LVFFDQPVIEKNFVHVQRSQFQTCEERFIGLKF
jgi:hypothetical protein